MSIEAIAEGVGRLVRRTALFGDRPLVAVMIANPRAGGFTRRRAYSRHLADLASLLAESEATGRERTAPTRFELRLTERPGHAAELVRELAAGLEDGAELLVVTAGGDGTSHEALAALIEFPAPLRERIAALRLPMGTGNDGSDGRDLRTALGRLVEPARFALLPCVRVVSADPARPAVPCFNIASVGFDAYVAHLTNVLKSSMPGDSYKILLDLMSVFYDRIFEVGRMGVRAFDSGGAEVRDLSRETLLVAMGVSGRRTYGSNKPILPDEDNVCAIFQMPLLRKLALKGPISRGFHRGLDVADLFSAERVELSYAGTLWAQADGEAWELGPTDFPLVLERTEPLVRVIEYRA